MRFLAVLALCVAAVAAGPTARSQRIVGGATTTIDQYPSIAALLYSRNLVTYGQACGGTIINPRSIVTAAHCPEDDLPAQWRIRLGSTFASSGGIVYNVASYINHAEYDDWSLDNDISIMRTATPIVYSNVIQPNSIAGSFYNLADNEVVWAAGWGYTQPNGQLSETLRHVQVWTVNQQVCIARYAALRWPVTDGMLCSGWLDVGGRDQCTGDSGGPLYHHGVLVGVCSWGYGCAHSNFPGVNTRVSHYTTWIQANA